MARLAYSARVCVLAAMVAAAGCVRPSARLEAFGEDARAVATNELPAGGWWSIPVEAVAEEELGHE